MPAFAQGAPVLSGRVAGVIAALPVLPSHLRYIDEHDDSTRTIPHPADNDQWPLLWDTQSLVMDFTAIGDPRLRFVGKWFMAWMVQNASPWSVSAQWRALNNVIGEHGDDWLSSALDRSPLEWAAYWDEEIRSSATDRRALFLKALLYFLSDLSLGDWRPGHRNFSQSLRFAWRSAKRNAVLSGEAMISVSEEAEIIAYFDELSRRVRDGKAATDRSLIDYCLTCMSYQHGLRPIQMSRMRYKDLRLYTDPDQQPVFHFVARRAKKRNPNDAKFFTRKVKHDWAWPFAEYFRRRSVELGDTTDAPAFPLELQEIGKAIGNRTEAITGVRRTATALRHSAAQRLADAGASIEEVANFLGHSYWETSLVYFEASETQAEQINKALAINPIYREIVNVARTKTIDKACLLGLPPDNQIGAVPHGLPISGIGGCGLGQSLCEMNPVLSCYTCRKFIPVDDTDLHRQVLQDLRGVVRFFYDESRGDRQSPAFAQIRTTLAAIQRAITDIEGSDAKDADHE